jgi:hypothetical protein
MFTPEDVTIYLIYHLVERGFTLEGAKTHLKEGQKKTDKFEIIRKLETIRTQLILKINFKIK